MIFGIGVDVLESRRMGETYARFGAHFVERLLLPAERAQFERSKNPQRFLAMRFAAKEAIVKALGTGFAHGIWIRDVGVVQNAWGKPEVVYSKRGDSVRRRLGVGDGFVTLTDEAGLIVAVAVLEKATAAPTRKSAARKGAARKSGARKSAVRKSAVPKSVVRGGKPLARKPGKTPSRKAATLVAKRRTPRKRSTR